MSKDTILSQRYSRIIILISLLTIISGYIANNLLWGLRSPIYFYRDSLMNIQWAVHYGKFFRNERLVYNPDLVQVLQEKNIQRDTNLYYREEYNETLKGPISGKKKITLQDLLKFHHPPLWFIYLGSFFAIFGFQSWAIFIAQAILGGITIWLTYILGKKVCSVPVGVVSAFMLSTLPSFLSLTRQGFLEAMVLPVLLLAIIYIDYILKYPSKRIYYLIFSSVCIIGILAKSIFFLYVLLLIVIAIIFSDKKYLRRSIYNFSVSIGTIILASLLWQLYNHEKLSFYYNMAIDKGMAQTLFNPGNIINMLLVLKNVQLENVLFILFILAVVIFYIKGRPANISYVVFFLIFGYVIIIFMPFAVIVRHFSPFLPLVIIVTCSVLMSFKYVRLHTIVFLLVFSLVRGYGWLIPNFPLLDQKLYFYDDIGTKRVKHSYSIYARDVEPHSFSAFAPLGPLRQRAIYGAIKKISSFSGVRVVRIIGPGKYAFEKKFLGGALSLYSIYENYPLIVEGPYREQYTPFEDRIWIILRDSEKDVDFSKGTLRDSSRLKYITGVLLSAKVMCDIFKENL